MSEQKKKLLFKSNYMGSKENDLIFSSFAKKHLNTLTQKETDLYESLLKENDIDLNHWVSGVRPFPKSYHGKLEHLLQKHYKSLKKG